MVLGHASIEAYLEAQAYCFKGMREKYQQIFNGYMPTAEDFDYFVFHTPFAKMVQKSFITLMIEDMLTPENVGKYKPELIELLKTKREDPSAQKQVFELFASQWKSKCAMTLNLPKQIGNTFTASMYMALISLLTEDSVNLQGKNIMCFSYGSGCSASMYSLHVVGDISKLKKAADYKDRLA